jgi:hypothetical protein
LGGSPSRICLPSSEESQFSISTDRIKNTGDTAVTLTDVALVGEERMALIEAVVLPFGQGFTDLHPPRSASWWERTPAVGATVEPSHTLNFAFAVEIEDPAFTDHVAVSYEDSSGRNYVARTSTQVHIRQNCSEVRDEPW